MTAIKGYVLYTRVSTKGQGESGLGLNAQTALLSHYLDDSDIVKHYTETASAKSLSERPVLKEAIAYCLANNYGLAVAKVDRLSRKTEHALEVYSKLGGMLYSCDIPCTKYAPMDKFTLTIFMAIADRERELIGIRTKQALTERYKNESWEQTHKGNIVSDAAREKSKQVRLAKALSGSEQVYCYIQVLRDSKDLSYRAIAKKLNNEDWATAKGGQFQANTVKRIYDRGLAAQVDC